MYKRAIYDSKGQSKQDLPIIKVLCQYLNFECVVILDERNNEEVGIVDLTRRTYASGERMFYMVKTIPDNTVKIYYKLVRAGIGELKSVIKHNESYNYTFAINEWVPAPTGMPFFIFDTFHNAIDYWASVGVYGINVRLFECEAQNVRQIPYVSDSFGNIKEFWQAYRKMMKNKKSKRNWESLIKKGLDLSIPPKGTLIASKIKITKERIDFNRNLDNALSALRR